MYVQYNFHLNCSSNDCLVSTTCPLWLYEASMWCVCIREQLALLRPNARLSHVCQSVVRSFDFSLSVFRSVFLSFFRSFHHKKSHILWPATTSVGHAFNILRHKTMYFGVCKNVLWVKTTICRWRTTSQSQVGQSIVL